MTTRNMPSTTLALKAAPIPQTLIARFVRAVIDGDGQSALSVLAAAGERRALPRRLLFGPKFERSCHRL